MTHDCGIVLGGDTAGDLTEKRSQLSASPEVTPLFEELSRLEGSWDHWHGEQLSCEE